MSKIEPKLQECKATPARVSFAGLEKCPIMTRTEGPKQFRAMHSCLGLIPLLGPALDPDFHKPTIAYNPLETSQLNYMKDTIIQTFQPLNS